MSCPACNSGSTDVIESRLCSNGTRRRRYACLTCRHRWTTWDGPRPRQGHAPGTKPKKRRWRPPLTMEEVLVVLTSPLSRAEIARQVSCSKQTVTAIQHGTYRADAWPEIPRKSPQVKPIAGLSCYDCRSWRGGRCFQGVPDPSEDGPAFAADCDFFESTALPIAP